MHLDGGFGLTCSYSTLFTAFELEGWLIYIYDVQAGLLSGLY
jgi:hypothetical protein